MYYSIGRSDDNKVIGHYPQTELKKNPTKGKHYDYFDLRNDQFPLKEPYFELELLKKAKPTNFLHQFIGLPGWIVDDKLKSILENYNLPSHRFYPVLVHQGNKTFHYHYFHFVIPDCWEFVNKRKSYGEIIKMEGGEIILDKNISVNSEREMIEEIKNYKFPFNIRMGKVFMVKEFNNYDLYFINYFSMVTVISERLKSKIEEENITGIKMTPWDRIIIEN